MIGAALCFVGHQACEATVPLAIGLAIDASVASGEPTALVLTLAGLIALFGVLTMCYRWFARLAGAAEIDEGHHLRTELAGRVMGGRGVRRRHGELLSIASSDADLAAGAVVWVSGLAGATAALAVSSAILLGIDLRLGAGLIVTAAAVTFALNALSPWLSRRVETQQETLAAASALATDLVTGLRVLHGLGAQRNAAARYREVSRHAERAGVRAGAAKAVQLGATVLAGGIVLAVSAAAAGLLALDGAITVGSFVAAVGAAQFISEPLAGIGLHLQIGASAKASAGRVAAVLAEAPDEPGATADDDAPLELDLRAGELVGVVARPAVVERAVAALRGDPGARGAVLRVDGEAGPVHVEPHRPDLFAGTIADNLALGRPADDAAPPDPGPAVAAAGAAEFVDAQPRGLAEPVRDRGLSLSGGQRQRLALARALHADPPVLVLVESTTAVDSVTEEIVADGIRSLRHPAGAGRTTVVFTTSPVLLSRTDRVVVVGEDGASVTGGHHDLLVRDAGYRAAVLG
ncbi:ABC transporter transmembrane domain-containing protein [Pseudonocardia humida]|uniref:ABC transporter ATP-binding protein n=1 Tax=Pseudonocardia humida TaxID=2800819 RepID=A0ABT1A6I4_9PSEU|nr:ABC transporter ATP-binding protein [Pseudonocardia humida]MCO1658586.1 ABC transporter ATP-binding protein [Pseudonocardia humida]